MKAAIRALILEKDKVRGMVPSPRYGKTDTVYGAYLTELNPRGNKDLQLALASSADPRFREFLDRLMSLRYKRMALATIAKGCGIDLAEFNKWWNQASTQQVIAIAQSKSLDITRDMAEDARTVDAVCERCDGLAFIPAQSGLPLETPGYRPMTGPEGEVLWVRSCPVCQNGKIRKPGDPHARDRVLEIGGLLQRGKSGINIIQNFGGASHSSAVQDLDDAMPLDVPFEVME